MKRTFGLIAAGAGIVIATTVGALSLATGPVAAHEGTAITLPAGGSGPAAALPTGEPTGTGVLFGVPEFVPTASSAEVAGDILTSPWVALAATGVFAAGAGAAAARRRRPAVAWPGGLRAGGALALLFAGVGHLAQTPSHWAEGAHLGVFFVASGLVLVAQAGLVLLRPSVAVYRSVVVSTVAIIVLYVLVRQFSLPLVNHQDPYLLREIPVKLAELFAANVALTALANLRSPAPAPSPRLAGTYT